MRQQRSVREGLGVVLFSAQDYWYHNRAHSDVQLARELSADRPVLLVNSLGMRLPRPGATTQPGRRILRKVRSTLRGLRRPEPEHPGLWVLSPFSLPVHGRPHLARLNAASVRAQVRVASAFAGIRTPDVIVTLPTAWEVARLNPVDGTAQMIAAVRAALGACSSPLK